MSSLSFNFYFTVDGTGSVTSLFYLDEALSMTCELKEEELRELSEELSKLLSKGLDFPSKPPFYYFIYIN